MGFNIGNAISGAQAGGSMGGPYAAIAGAVIGGFAGGGGDEQKAVDAQGQGLDQGIAFERESRDISLGLNRPFQQTSYNALNAMNSMVGLPNVGGRVDAQGKPIIERANIQSKRDAIKWAESEGYSTEWTNSSESDAHYMGSYLWDRMNGRVEKPTASGGGDATNRDFRASGLGGLGGLTGGGGRAGGLKGVIGGFQRHLAAKEDKPKTYGGMGNEYREKYAPTEKEDLAAAQGEEYNWKTDPGYAFRLAEGNKALAGRQAAGGSYLSGGAIKEAQRYNQEFASAEFGNIYNRLGVLAGYGPQAAATSSAAALQAGTNMGQAAAAKGYNRASGYANRANQKDQMVGTVIENAPAIWDWASGLFGGGGGGGGYGAGGSVGIGGIGGGGSTGGVGSIGGGGSQFSDIRLKTDIKSIGTSPSGIPMYQFKYVWGDEVYQGAMAQDLLETHPHAVVMKPNGYYGVNYDEIDVDFSLAGNAHAI